MQYPPRWASSFNFPVPLMPDSARQELQEHSCGSRAVWKRCTETYGVGRQCVILYSFLAAFSLTESAARQGGLSPPVCPL